MRRAGTILVIGTLLIAPLISGAAADARDTADAATSPIVSVAPDEVLDCTTASTRSDWLQFFSYVVEFPPADSCATVVAVAGFGLFGPPDFGDFYGQVAGTTLNAYEPVSQTTVPPSAANGSTLQVTTVVRLPGTGLVLRQRDTYVDGQRYVLTSVRIENHAAAARDVVVYRTGDCFPGSDVGFGIARRFAVGCEQAVQDGLNAVPIAGPVYMRWVPTKGTSHHAVAVVDDLRAAIASGAPLADSCSCTSAQDIAAALSWSLHIEHESAQVVASRLTYAVGAGRHRTKITAGAAAAHGVTRFTAAVTSAGSPIAKAPVDFVVGSLTACSAVTKINGEASCSVAGDPPAFVARYRGDTSYQPANAAYTPDSAPPPPSDPPGFPACAHFDRSGAALVTGGDAHHETVFSATEAPPCPVVQYTAYGDGVILGEMRGDLRATDLFGAPVPGMAVLFIEGSFGFVGPTCVYVTATDTRTGEVLDTFPGPGDDQQCIFEVGGQKYR